MLAIPIEVPQNTQHGVVVAKHQNVKFVQSPYKFLLKGKVLTRDGEPVDIQNHKVVAHKKGILNSVFQIYSSCLPTLKTVLSINFKMAKYHQAFSKPNINPKGCYLVRGYASQEGGKLYNYDLSVKRAQFVMRKLKKNYPNAQFDFKGYGEGCRVGRKVIVEELRCGSR